LTGAELTDSSSAIRWVMLIIARFREIAGQALCRTARR